MPPEQALSEQSKLLADGSHLENLIVMFSTLEHEFPGLYADNSHPNVILQVAVSLKKLKRHAALFIGSKLLSLILYEKSE